MIAVFDLDVDINWGHADAPLPEWRRSQLLDDEDADADDEELSVTPADVIAMLGFDPKEFSDGSS